ncbi:MAG: LacI family DNA-binding transcriptional regulator [Eubacteriales bacterium]|nr:LacI family DNA-binding transcriptional regulator [Eubacteriales bacterium]
MRAFRVTLKDIAQACGYSVNTVSRALRGDEHLSESTRSLIREAAGRMGYIPNTMASSLRSGRSRMIAVIVNDLRNQHYCDLINRMDRELRARNYNLMILCMQLEDALAEKLIHTAISLSVDGILYFPSLGQRHYVEYMLDNGMPFVLLDRRVNELDADTVRCDDEQGGYLAGRHLAELGHRRFLFLSGMELSSSQIDRLSGFRRALREGGLPEDCVRVVPGAQVESALAGNELGKLILPKDYTAIVSFRDEVAYPVMHALREQGFSIPGDVSIISFDNLRAEDPSRPCLTSIYAADENIAALGVRMLLERIEEPSLPPRNMVLPVRIYEQGTTAPPAKENG